MSKILSIIIPIYNVEDFLTDCLDSIYNQELDEQLYEIIAVIDGSRDSSVEIVWNFAKLHSNLLIVEKENGGVSSARNAGVKIAQGKYLMFVDADDCLFEESLSQVIECIKCSNLDYFVFRSFKRECGYEVYQWREFLDKDTCYTGNEVYEKWGIRTSVCGAVYNRDFWIKHKIEFPLNIKNSEDAIVSLQCQCKAKQICFSDIKLYNINLHPDSASHDMTLERLSSWFDALNVIRKIKERNSVAIEIAMCDSLSYSIISDITNRAISILGLKALQFLKTNQIHLFLPISKHSIRYSSFTNRFMKHIINLSFELFFIISYFRTKL